MATVLSVKIMSPREDLFSGEVLALSSKNSTGKFDILPEHANFVTLVENEPIVLQLLNKEKKEFKFPLAIVHCANNKVTVYTDINAEGKLLSDKKI